MTLIDQKGRIYRIGCVISIKGMMIKTPPCFHVNARSIAVEQRPVHTAIVHTGRICRNPPVRGKGIGFQRVEIQSGNELKAGINPVIEIGFGMVMYPIEMAECSPFARRSEEHKSELQSLLRILYAVF